jgi:tRNA (guanine-N7-)-methyltransferase
MDSAKQSKTGNFRGIRSYVLRTAKMTRGQRQAYQELYPRYGIQDQSVDPKNIFPEAQERILEIGFGMGAATIEMALLEPQNAFLGVEVHTPGVGKLLSEIEQRKIKNLRVIHDDINLVLPMIKVQSFDGIHVFFPDPWQKKRHHKRRLLQADFLSKLLPIVKPEGFLYIATDWQDYAESILEEAAKVSGWFNPYTTYADHPRPRPKTKFEERGRQEKRPILEIYLKRKN